MNLSEHCEPALRLQDLELIIDLSNVCREISFDGVKGVARWDRLIRVLMTWNSTFKNFEKPKIKLVQDNNLRFMFSEADKTHLRNAEKNGFIIEQDKADPAILDLAEKSDAFVLSNDNYVAYHRGRPWITSTERERFVKMMFTNGELQLRLGIIASKKDFTMSKMEEIDSLKDNRIDPNNEKNSVFFESSYRCENRDCIRRQVIPDGAYHLPAKGQNGEVVCSGCRLPMSRLGSSKPAAIIKIRSRLNGNVIRFPIERGQSLVIGRSNSDVSLSEVVNESDLSRISRSHLKIEYTDTKILITDLSSSNGSVFFAGNHDENYPSREQIMNANEKTSLGTHDVVVVAGILELSRSGRRFSFDLALPKIERRPEDSETKTRLG